MEKLIHPKIRQVIDEEVKQLMEKGEWEQAKILGNQTVIRSEIGKEEANHFSQLATFYEQKGMHLMSQVMAFKAKVLAQDEVWLTQAKEEIDGLLAAAREQWEKRKNEPLFYYEMACMYASKLKMVESCIFYKLYKKLREESRQKEQTNKDELQQLIEEYEWIGRIEKGLIGEEIYCILSETVEEISRQEMLVWALSEIGKQVYQIMPPVTLEVAQEYFDTGKLEVIEEEGNYGRIIPICYQCKEQIKEWDLGRLLVRLSENYCQEECWILLGNKQRLAGLMGEMAVYKCLQKYYVEEGVGEWQVNSLFLMGNYFKAANYLYQFDVKTQMETVPECKVSMVIPVRRYVPTLEYTLKTCLEQRVAEFEVVLSDNSDEEDTRIYDLAKRLNHPKLKYYKTPYVLPLQKSFEYAFFRAKGEILFALGADDGVLPYTAGHLTKVMESYPDENIVLWDRLYYNWVDSSINPQGDTFSFYNNVEKEKYNVHTASRDYLLGVLLSEINQGRATIYSLPMLYINSGMRRRHIFEMVKRTGKFLDGSSQDVYTGIVTAAMYDHVIYEAYPLVISGSSDQSIGASTKRMNKSLKQLKSYVSSYNLATEFVDIPSTPSQRMMFPQFDYALFAYELLKVKDLGIDPIVNNWVNEVEFLNLFSKLVAENCIREEEYIDALPRIRACAYANSQFVGKWVEEFIQKNNHRKILEKNLLEEPDQEEEKKYQNPLYIGYYGKNITVRCETMGIHDIYEASQFFVNLFNL